MILSPFPPLHLLALLLFFLFFPNAFVDLMVSFQTE
jgi:hypothetical protein